MQNSFIHDLIQGSQHWQLNQQCSSESKSDLSTQFITRRPNYQREIEYFSRCARNSGKSMFFIVDMQRAICGRIYLQYWRQISRCTEMDLSALQPPHSMSWPPSPPSSSPPSLLSPLPQPPASWSYPFITIINYNDYHHHHHNCNHQCSDIKSY